MGSDLIPRDMGLSTMVRDRILEDCTPAMLPFIDKNCVRRYEGGVISKADEMNSISHLEVVNKILLPVMEAVSIASNGNIQVAPGYYAQCKVLWMRKKEQFQIKHQDRWKPVLRQYSDQFTTIGCPDGRLVVSISRTVDSQHAWIVTKQMEHPRYKGTGSVGPGIKYDGMASMYALITKLHNADNAHAACTADEDGDRLMANVDWVVLNGMTIEKAEDIIHEQMRIVLAKLNGTAVEAKKAAVSGGMKAYSRNKKQRTTDNLNKFMRGRNFEQNK